MGAISNTTGWLEFAERPPVSQGGRTNHTVYANVTMSDSYLAGGDPLVVPDHGRLIAMTLNPQFDGRYAYFWNGSQEDARIRAIRVIGGSEECADETDLSNTVMTAILVYER